MATGGRPPSATMHVLVFAKVLTAACHIVLPAVPSLPVARKLFLFYHCLRATAIQNPAEVASHSMHVSANSLRVMFLAGM